MESKINKGKEILKQGTYKKIIQKLQNIRKKTIIKESLRGKEKIMTQRELSSKLGKETRYINKIENLKEELDLITFINICNHLNITSNKVLSEFVINDLENNSFNKLNKTMKEIIRKFVDILADNHEYKNVTEVQDFNIDVLAQRIKDFRLNQNIGSRELSAKINYASSYISNIERNVNNISLPAFIAICNALNCTPNDLLYPFINKQNLSDYNNLHEEHKFLVDTLIELCNQRQQEVGYCYTRKLTPEELEAHLNKLGLKS